LTGPDRGGRGEGEGTRAEGVKNKDPQLYASQVSTGGGFSGCRQGCAEGVRRVFLLLTELCFCFCFCLGLHWLTSAIWLTMVTNADKVSFTYVWQAFFEYV
jgi:hypothetical protein